MARHTSWAGFLMYAETLTRLLAMMPAGLTSDQILYYLRRTGLRPGADEIGQSLVDLVNSGAASVVAGGKWRLNRFAPGEPSRTNEPGGGGDRSSRDAVQVLRAISGRAVQNRLDDADPASAADLTGETRADADWRKLLSYYAATQRLDPRGSVDARVDMHARNWQLIRVDGDWWADCRLSFSLDVLPPEFREAVTRRSEVACSIGYPVSTFQDRGLTAVVPALLLPAMLRFDATHAMLEITEPTPSLNPRWLALVLSRLRGWQKDRLVEALLPDGESTAFDQVVQRLANAVATIGGRHLRPGVLSSEIVLDSEGVRNSAAIFLATDARFTQGTEHDLVVMSEWSEVALHATSASRLLCHSAGPDVLLPNAPPPAAPRVLTDRQYDAVVTALSQKLTVIHGPPGTGKSEVILAILISLCLSGRTALLVSRNHRALDEVEERLTRISGDTPLLTRARDRDGDRDTNLLDQLRQLTGGDARAGTTVGLLSSDVNRDAWTVLEAWQHRRRLEALNVELSGAVERLDRWNVAVGQVATMVPSGWSRMRSRVRNWLRRARGRAATVVDNRLELERRIDGLRRELAGVPSLPSPETLHRLAAALAATVSDGLARQVSVTTLPTHAERQRLMDCHQALRFSGRDKSAQMTAEEANLVLAHRPIWAVSALSAATRLPLVPGMFDFVIFDEASQCDIASALPLFGRAKQAIVVGDPMQLGFIPSLALRQERALMDAAGLGTIDRHIVAQSQTSLFEFSARRAGSNRRFLSDQFRSHEAIVAYLNEAFYGGRLIAAHDARTARWPNDYKPGLGWHDVRGRASREDGGNVNHAEADGIIELLIDMIRTKRFAGSVGVISPFNAQVSLLERRVRGALTEEERQSVQVSTIDRLQGGEADVILFSTVVGEGAHAGALMFYERERRRLNVAISRARALCLVVGDKSFAARSRIQPLAFLATVIDRPPRQRDPFDSDWERRLHDALRGRGIEAIPQYPVGSRFLDLAIDPEGRKLDVEVDGRLWHADPDGIRKTADQLRDLELQARGWSVRRFWVHELAENMETCLDLVERDLGRA